MLAGDWGFGLEELAVEPERMVMWYGDLDVNVPLAMARKGVELMPGAELRVVEGDNHFNLFSKMDDIMSTMKHMLT